MDYELKLTKVNRMKLARAFHANPRVDCAIPCIVEGQMGRAFADDLVQPTAYCITVGPFWYFAGQAHGPGGRRMLQGFPAYNLFMPSPPAWLEVAREVIGTPLQPFARYSFSGDDLSVEHLQALVAGSPHRDRLQPLDAQLTSQLVAQPDSYLEIGEFDSIPDFLERGLGFVALDGEVVMGAAYSSLVYSAGIEVSLYVAEPYRRQGVGTVLAGRLLFESLRRNLRPNWDAANPESCRLALKLGYVFTGSYDAYYYTSG